MNLIKQWKSAKEYSKTHKEVDIPKVQNAFEPLKTHWGWFWLLFVAGLLFTSPFILFIAFVLAIDNWWTEYKINRREEFIQIIKEAQK